MMIKPGVVGLHEEYDDTRYYIQVRTADDGLVVDVFDFHGEKVLGTFHRTWTEVIEMVLEQEPLRMWRLTVADIEEVAGRPVTEDELEQIRTGLDHSTVMETLNTVVDSVCGPAPEED